jgi:hypothetical protein
MPRFALMLSVSVIAAWAAGCSSSTQGVTSPSASKCTVSVTATPTSFQAGGGTGTLSITTSRDCEWSATAASGWIQLGESTTGQGDGTLSFTVARNADPSVRKGAITVGTQQVELTQDAAQCVITITPPNGVIGAVGGPGTHTVTASSPQCAWTARSEVEWMSIVEGAQGSGNGQVRYEAQRNSGPTRTGTLTIAGQAVVITQPGGCAYTLQPGSADIGQSGGAGRVTVTTFQGCPWTAASTAPWVTLTEAAGSGTGAFAYSVAANTMGVPARSASVSVGDQTFRVTQAAGPECTYTVSPNIQVFPAAGGTSGFSVTTGGVCAWTAVSTAPWITISGSPGGTGNGRVSFTVSPNTPGGPERAATITVGRSIFTVIQNAI